MPIESLHIPLAIDFPAIDDPFGEVRVRDVESAETYGVAVAFSHLSQPCHLIEGVIADYEAFVIRSEGFADIRDLLPLT